MWSCLLQNKSVSPFKASNTAVEVACRMRILAYVITVTDIVNLAMANVADSCVAMVSFSLGCAFLEWESFAARQSSGSNVAFVAGGATVVVAIHVCVRASISTVKHVEIHPTDVAFCEGRSVIIRPSSRLCPVLQRFTLITGNSKHENPVVNALLDLWNDSLKTILAAVVVTGVVARVVALGKVRDLAPTDITVER